MKKIILILFISSAFQSFSQKTGVKGGLNLGREVAKGGGISLESNNLVSLVAGIFTEVPTGNESFFFSPELLYSVDGGEFQLGIISGKDRLTYLSVPLLLKYYTSKSFNIHGGPQFGYLLKGETTVNGQTIETTDSIKKLNVSLDIGAEYSFTSLSLGLRYVIGLSDISEDDPSSSTDSSVKLNSLQIYLAVPF